MRETQTLPDVQNPSATAQAIDQARWLAVVRRDGSADGEFFFGVTSTGVYCYPSCAARRPRRHRVRYFVTRADAEAAGFRPCGRCRSDLDTPAQRRARLIAAACASLQNTPEASLAQLAGQAQMSPSHFQRIFKFHVGLSPKQYALAQRAHRLRQGLAAGERVTDAVYGAGYGSSSRFYERAGAVLGMHPKDYLHGGSNQRIVFRIADCWAGKVLIAMTRMGVCAILFGESDRALCTELAQRFPGADIVAIDQDTALAANVARVLAYLDSPRGDFPLPLDIRGTAFQERVWRVLGQIPAGATATYAEVARAIGQPAAARAVAGACAANCLAVAVPCHRVVRGDGKLGGYRWGAARKRALVDRERGLVASERAEPTVLGKAVDETA